MRAFFILRAASSETDRDVHEIRDHLVALAQLGRRRRRLRMSRGPAKLRVVAWRLAFALVVLGGCYADLRGGPSVPIGFGHGDAAAEFMLAVGGEHAGERLRIGGGVATGTRAATHTSVGEYYTPMGIDGHIAVLLAPRSQWVAVAHVTAGHARGNIDGTYGRAPSGIFGEAFVGIGLGRTHDQPGSDIPRGHIAVGPSATWFQTDAGDSFWFVGGMLEVSLGFGTLP